jgi:hypothetical protein
MKTLKNSIMKTFAIVIFLATIVEANADLEEYVFVPYDTTGPAVSGVVWTDPAFDTLSGYLNIPGFFYVDFSDTLFGNFRISPTSVFQSSPPYLTPFIITGYEQSYTSAYLGAAGYAAGDGAAVQAWRFTPGDDPPYLSAQSGDGVWQLASTVPDTNSSALLLLLGMSFVFGFNRLRSQIF